MAGAFMTPSSFSTLVSLFLVLSVSNVHGFILPFERRAPRGARMTSPRSPSRYSFASADAETVVNKNDMRYATTITLNGKEVSVALDTGSTDLWVNPPGGVGVFNDTQIPVTLAYGDGSYGAKGTVGLAQFQFGSYSVDKQAFMDVTESTIKGLDDIGVYGILGLSFDLASVSHINDNIKLAYPGATWGASVLHNIFNQNPTKPNFIAIDLSRSADLEETNGGSFYISEYDPRYSAVANAPKLAQYPVGGNRWTALLEGINVNGNAIPVKSTVAGVPAGHAQAMFDTGDPTALFPTAIWDAIYSNIPGAAKFDQGNSVWIIPCNTTTSVELVFGGQKYPIHPLDLSTISDPISLGSSEVIACVSAFRGVDGFADQGYEISLGDGFLRNVYAAFDFGDTTSGTTSTSKPFIQLLNQIDPTKAAGQVASIRGKTLATLPPELPPAELVQLILGSAPTDPTDPVSPNGDHVTHGEGEAKSASVEASVEDNQIKPTFNDDLVKKYGLIAISLLAVNVFIGLILLSFAILSCVKKGSTRRRRSNSIMGGVGSTQYAPVKSDEVYSTSYQKGYGQ